MPNLKLTVNGHPYTVDVDPSMPLLWVLRDTLGLTGTKFSCGAGLCGACTVHLDGEAVRSCVTPITAVAGKAITTIEGLSPESQHPLQRAWIETHVAQCGYCQSGQLMTAAAFLAKNTKPSDAELEAAMSSTLCRCGTYNRIRRAIQLAIEEGKVK